MSNTEPSTDLSLIIRDNGKDASPITSSKPGSFINTSRNRTSKTTADDDHSHLSSSTTVWSAFSFSYRPLLFLITLIGSKTGNKQAKGASSFISGIDSVATLEISEGAATNSHWLELLQALAFLTFVHLAPDRICKSASWLRLQGE